MKNLYNMCCKNKDYKDLNLKDKEITSEETDKFEQDINFAKCLACISLIFVAVPLVVVTSHKINKKFKNRK